MNVSVVTICRNSAATLGETIESVCAQSYGSIEHLIIDGGSVDGTLDVIARNAARVAGYVSEPDRGIYDAMNKGIRRATGDIVGFLNADDIFADESAVESIVDVFERTGADAVYGDLVFVGRNDPGRRIRTYSSARFSRERIGYGWMPAHPTIYCRRGVFEKYGLFKEDYRIAGDFEFVARTFSDPSFRYEYLPKVLVRMRMGGVSTGGFANTVLLNREVLRACRENSIRTNLVKILSKYPAKIMEFV